MTINWMPAEYNQRRPKTSYLLGQAIGESLGKASDMYLKGKMENYFQNQKDERASKIEQAERKRAGSALAELEGQPERGRIYENLTPSMLQERSKAVNEVLTNSANSSTASAFARHGQGQPYSKIPGVAPERQAEAEKTKNYQAESEMLNPNAGQKGQQGQPAGGAEGQPPPQPQSIQDQILQKHNNRIAGLDAVRNDLYQNPNANSKQIEASYKNELERAQQQFDNDMKVAGPQIEREKAQEKNLMERETAEIKAQDETTRKRVGDVYEKAENAKTILARLDDLDKLIEKKGVGYSGQGGIGYSAGSIPRMLPWGLGDRIGKELDTLSGAEPIRAAYDEIAKMNLEVFKGALARGISNKSEFEQYSHIISNATDTPSIAKAKNDALRTILERDVKKKELYDSIQNPDGTYPKNASKLIDELTKESDSQIKKQIDAVSKAVTPSEGHVFMLSPPTLSHPEGKLFECPIDKIKETEILGYKRQ